MKRSGNLKALPQDRSHKDLAYYECTGHYHEAHLNHVSCKIALSFSFAVRNVKKYGIINMTIHLVEIQQARITNETITWGSRSRTKGRKIRHLSEILSTRERTLVTDLVPSEMACLESSPGRIKRTEVWISREEMVDFLEYDASSERTKSQ